MQSVPVKRKRRLAAVMSTAALAVVAGLTAGAPAANAATPDISVTLSPASGTDFTTDTGTLSWTLPSACVGQQLADFLYPGTARWNATTINQALGNTTQAQYYGAFYDTYGKAPATATGSASWPNVAAPGYQSFVAGPTYATTAAYVAAQGTGYHTIGLVCTDSSGVPLKDSSGNLIAGSLLLNLGATGNSWAVSTAIGTQVALTGSGTAPTNGTPGKVSLTAHVTASNHSVAAGGVNFYAGTSATGKPLNGSTPVPVGSTGKASYAGPSGYTSGACYGAGGQAYYAKFVPAHPAKYTPSSVAAVIYLIKERVTIKVTATQDPSSATSVDLVAKGTGTPTNLYKSLMACTGAAGGVDFIVDGTVVSGPNNGSYDTPFPFNSNGLASHIIAGLSPGTHTFSALLANYRNTTQGPGTGYAVRVNTVQFTVK